VTAIAKRQYRWDIVISHPTANRVEAVSFGAGNEDQASRLQDNGTFEPREPDEVTAEGWTTYAPDGTTNRTVPTVQQLVRFDLRLRVLTGRRYIPARKAT